ncbi:hypothetical protein CHJ25_00220 [Listeria monocytogenes]|nr:hypothetical protein [Listeria monocytogenes]EAF1527926.1 hypothetical protein [Listeria monocytogenes]EHK9296204.1 hypothetical protein [Listeria monocytogenes]
MSKLLNLQVVTFRNVTVKNGTLRLEVGYGAVDSISYDRDLDLIVVGFNDGAKTYTKTPLWDGTSFEEGQNEI